MIKKKIPTKYNMSNFNWQELATQALGKNTPISWFASERMVVFYDDLPQNQLILLKSKFLEMAEEVTEL